jgi:cyclophilin family peptidyl-prolyl cis-trans isomerase
LSLKKLYKPCYIFINMKVKSVLIGLVILIILIAAFSISKNMVGKAIKENEKPKVKLSTNKGDIVIELYAKEAPLTVKNFLMYVNDGTFDNTVFHRVIKGFMIQGGGYTADGRPKPTKSPIKLESDNNLKNDLGYVAMARTTDPNSATDQFFINTANNDFLNKGVRDDGYAVFGKVIAGLDVVYAIEDSKTTVKNGMPDWPVGDIVITKAEVVKE